jgi:hypothetical protein
MKQPMVNATNVIAIAGVFVFGYVFFASLPNLRRYIRIQHRVSHGPRETTIIGLPLRNYAAQVCGIMLGSRPRAHVHIDVR